MPKKILTLILPLILLGLQMYLTMYGGDKFGQYFNPVLLFFVSVSTPIYFFIVVLGNDNSAHTPLNVGSKIFALLLGFASIAICHNMLHKLFYTYQPGAYSDVIPQLDAQYDRFSHGIFPYQPVHFSTYDAYPVYMPLNWLPLGISRFLKIDSRWSGILLLTVAAAVYGYSVFKEKQNIILKIFIILLPSLALWSYLLPGTSEMAVSLETIIAAYYLVLATGLASRNLVLTTVGIIFCLLSRYTFVFWLPLFFILLWYNRPAKTNLMVYASVFIAVMALYIVPFILKDPSILSRGLKYHNDAAVHEWDGNGGGISWTFMHGVNFAVHMKYLFTGSLEHRVFLARAVQASCMIGLLLFGLLAYRRWRHRIGFYDFSLAMLYLFILFFYMFGPLTYQYYCMVLLIISAVITGRIILIGMTGKSREKSMPVQNME